ncbi:MAG: hypothetical protein J5482_00555 [Oscillospiraceae bacterium]|nr:hypothetical protein [Oscillospiraceae bacterium]
MLGKLLKYELRATARILLPVYLLLMVLAGLCRLFLELSAQYDAPALGIFQNITSLLFFLSLAGVTALSVLLMIYRFYKNLMTDEGYLMFTLPVTVDQIIWSKLLVAELWTVVTVAVDFGAVALCGAMKDLSLTDLWAAVQEIWTTPGLPHGHLIGWLAECAVLLLLSPLSSMLMYYAAIAVGHSFPNHKILLSFAFYFAFSVGVQIVGSFASMYGLIALGSDWIITETFTPDIPHAFLISMICSSLVLCAAFYLTTRLTLKKRLNLQ